MKKQTYEEEQYFILKCLRDSKALIEQMHDERAKAIAYAEDEIDIGIPVFSHDTEEDCEKLNEMIEAFDTVISWYE